MLILIRCIVFCLIFSVTVAFGEEGLIEGLSRCTCLSMPWGSVSLVVMSVSISA